MLGDVVVMSVFGIAGAGVDGWRLNVVTVDVALTGADTAVSVEIDWS